VPDNHKLKLLADARLLALEFVVVRLFSDVHRDLSDLDFDALLKNYWDDLDAATIPGVDPVTSDAIAAEVRDSVETLLRRARPPPVVFPITAVPEIEFPTFHRGHEIFHRGHEITLVGGVGWSASICDPARMGLPTSASSSMVEGPDCCLSRARDLIDLYLDVPDALKLQL
jgi:hypothetical protein